MDNNTRGRGRNDPAAQAVGYPAYVDTGEEPLPMGHAEANRFMGFPPGKADERKEVITDADGKPVILLMISLEGDVYVTAHVTACTLQRRGEGGPLHGIRTVPARNTDTHKFTALEYVHIEKVLGVTSKLYTKE